jgi:hypothetical protein
MPELLKESPGSVRRGLDPQGHDLFVFVSGLDQREFRQGSGNDAVPAGLAIPLDHEATVLVPFVRALLGQTRPFALELIQLVRLQRHREEESHQPGEAQGVA